MKKTLKSVMALVFCVVMVVATATIAFAALGNVTNLKATNVTYNSATLTWSKASGADGYQVRPYTSKKYGTTVTTKNTSYTAKLTPGASYYFYVRSYDRSWSLKGYKYTYGSWAKVSVKAVPAQVKGLKATQSGSSVKLTWTKVPSISGYYVQQNVSGKYKNIKSLSSSYNSYTVTGLPYGSTQQFRVVAYAKSGSKKIYGSYSSVAKVQLKPGRPGSTIKSKDITASSGYIYWSGSTGATGYQVYDYSTKKTITTGSKKYLTVKSLKPGTKYSFKVRAYAKYGSSTVYSAYSTTLHSFTTAPAAITGVKVSNITDSSVKVTWSKATGATGYQVYYKISGGSSWKRADVTTANYSTITGLKPNSKYAIRVRGYVKNTCGYSYGAFTTYKYVVTKMAAPVITSSNNTETQVNLSWNKVSGAAYYILQYYSTSTHDWADVVDSSKNTIKFTETSYTDTVASNSIKTYRAIAVKSNGEQGVIAKGTAVAPKGISVKQDAYSVTVTWGDIENYFKTGSYQDMSAYDIYTINTLNTSSYKGWTYSESINAKDLDSYTFALTPGSVVSYLIHARPADGTSSFKVVEFTVDAADFKIDNSDAGKNSQILFFVDAVNKTKLEQGKVTVSCDTSAVMDLDSIFIDGDFELGKTDVLSAGLILAFEAMAKDGVITGAEIKSFTDDALKLGLIEEEDIPELSSDEKHSDGYVFVDGKATTEDGKTVSLKKYIEPSSTSDSLAYLYNKNDLDAWKNGFSSVKTAQYSDGRYKFTATLKQEKFGVEVNTKSSLYHPGLVSTLEGNTLTTSSGSTNQLTTVGETTIVAVINTDGTLDSLTIKSPFSTKFFEAVTDSLSLGMQMSGTTSSSYKFKR